MVTFKLIQLYPGSKPLGYILKPVNNGLTKPDNYYQNGIWFNPSDYPKYWQEVKESSLLEEKAEEYILMNKPLLSLSDVWDNLKVKDQKEVMKFVKSKLNK